MIALLHGVVDTRIDPYLIIDVNDVGYKVFVSNSILSKAIIGEKIKLYIYTHVREDVFDLYGFLEPEDLKLFELCISVSGVGPKTAIGIFSVGSRDEIIKSIIGGDVVFFTSVPRLGKKNAQKLIIELKSKLGNREEFDINASDSEKDEVIAALKGFGFSSGEAYKALRGVDKEGLSTSEMVRMALKQLGK